MNNTVPYTDMKDSGIKWIGSVPASWNVRTLYQLATRVNNKNSDLSEQNLLSLSYGKIKRKDINTNDGLLPASFDGYNIIEAGDIVLRLTDLQNDHTSLRVGHATERGIITSAYTTLRPINPAHSRYLYYLIHAFDLKKGFYGMGSGVRQGLNYDEVKELRVVLPPQKEQDAIATYLDDVCQQIDLMIDEATASLGEYREWRITVIQNAVTKGVCPQREMKTSQLDWIEEIPATWETKKIKFFGDQSALHSETNSGYIGLENVESGTGRYIESKNNDFEAEGVALQIAPGDVIFGKLRPYLAKSYLVTENGCCSTEFIVIHANKCCPRYLKYVMLSPKFVDIINMSTYGAKMPRANWNFIGSVKAPFPTIEEQEEIADSLDEHCARIDSLITEKRKLIEELELYKRSLIYETVTGKRKVV